MDLQSVTGIVGVLLVWGAPLLFLAVVTVRFIQKRQRNQRRREARTGSAGPPNQSVTHFASNGVGGAEPASPDSGREPQAARWTMRRRDRAIRDPGKVAEIVASATVCRLALAAADEPYLVTLNFGTAGDLAGAIVWDDAGCCFQAREGAAPCFYFHSARDGRKVAIIRNNPRVCFEITGRHEIVPGEEACRWTTRYESVVGDGKVTEVTAEDEMREGLEAILRQGGATGTIDLPAAAIHGVAVLRLTMSELSGKSNWPAEK